VPEQALDDQREAERQQEAIQVVELIEALEGRAFEHDPDHSHNDGRDEQCHQ